MAVPHRPVDLVTRKEWLRLLTVMILLTAFALLIVFVLGNHAGTPTQRTP